MSEADWIFIPILSCYVLFPFLFSLTFGTGEDLGWDMYDAYLHGLVCGFLFAPLGITLMVLYWLFLLGGKIRDLLVGKQ